MFADQRIERTRTTTSTRTITITGFRAAWFTDEQFMCLAVDVPANGRRATMVGARNRSRARSRARPLIRSKLLPYLPGMLTQ